MKKEKFFEIVELAEILGEDKQKLMSKVTVGTNPFMRRIKRERKKLSISPRLQLSAQSIRAALDEEKDKVLKKLAGLNRIIDRLDAYEEDSTKGITIECDESTDLETAQWESIRSFRATRGEKK